MKIAYFDCSSGISGDMCLGAIVDAGVSIKYLEKELNKIPVRGYKLSVKKVKRTHFRATKVDVVQGSKTKVKDIKRWKDIERIIQRSSLSDDIKQKGYKIFKRIFEAEAKVHGEAYDKLHLHELGAVDCVTDIFGTIIGLSILGIDKVYSSPVNLGSGFIKSEAGVLPVPAPATAEILKKVPVYSKGVSFELTTPTGAAIIKELSSSFGDIPVMDIEMIGIGAGDRDFKDSPNILRLFVGNKKHFNSDRNSEGVMVVEANIDDMNPQIYEYVMEKLFKAGALDVYFTQVVMKKGRPGVKMTVLCTKELIENMIEIILKETSTIGLRFFENKRRILQREVKKINTEFGKVRVKFSRFGDDVLKMTPEYEDCKRIAKKFNIPLIEIMKKIK
ncbi:MAG: TIGR00299 family protein [Nitrospirae bacterium RBG_13_39_12]|nr:MAG: TIGR00299 family protein [Nitrospirae bacterium RBG_13_39_12]